MSTGDALLKISEVLWKVFLVFLVLWVVLAVINLVFQPRPQSVNDYFAPALPQEGSGPIG